MWFSTGGEKTKKILIFGIIAAIAFVAVGISAIATDGRIFIGDDEEADHIGDAVITTEEAVTIAEEHTGGTALSVELENENDYLVYGVIIETPDGKFDVKVDAGNGNVLKVESDSEDEE